mgnify:CR=1 FL=1
MTRIVGHVVTKDEAHRYLVPCLNWLRGIVDVIHVFDDRSTDGTPALAAEFGALVDVRLRTVASFIENEMTFRQAAWTAMTRAAELADGDWVLAIDADEFLIANHAHDQTQLAATVRHAETLGVPIVGFPVAEVFAFGVDAAQRPLVRVDGWWGTMQADRLTRWSPTARFRAKRLNGRDCGSIPFVDDIPRPDQVAVRSDDLTILHYGYATPEDQAAKYARYVNERGHNKLHVRSILQRPKLEPWHGRIPDGL